MREIKFRQYLINGFHYWGFINRAFIGPAVQQGEKYNVSEQYTGLKDKNGKEIYEGDIIGDGECSPEEVIFEEGSWIGRCEVGTDKLYELKYLEVIGNIYENPNLIDTNL